MIEDQGASAKADRAAGLRPQPPSASSQSSIPSANSGAMDGYYGILNAQGDFWSHTVHSNKNDARDYIRRFWGADTASADWCLRKFKIIPVRANLVALEALDIEAVKPKRRGRKSLAQAIEATPTLEE